MPEDPADANLNPYAPPENAESEPAAAESDPEGFKPDWRSMGSFLAVQSHNVLNDKITQFALIGLMGIVAAGPGFAEGSRTHSILENYDLFISVWMSLPFVLFAPIVGWLSDRFSKRTVIIWCLIIQVCVLAGTAYSLKLQAVWLTSLGFFLLAIQSTLLSPAKYGICKEFVGSQKLAVANGWLQMLTIASLICGTLIGGKAFASLAGVELEEGMSVTAAQVDQAWNAAAIIVVVLLGFSFVPFLVMRMVAKPPARSKQPFRSKIVFAHFRHLREVLGHRELRLAAIGDMFFWFAGGAVALILIQAGWEVYSKGDSRAIAVSSFFNGAVGLGFVLGSLLVAVICKHRNELGLIPIGAIGMSFFLSILILQDQGSIFYYATLFGTGLSSTIFFVPLTVLIQDLAEESKRGRVLSAVNLMNSLASLLAIAVVFAMRGMGLSTGVQFLILGALSFGVAIFILQLMPRHFLQFILIGLTRILYRIKPLNADRIPKEGGLLMISNHVSYIDAFIISAACPRPVRFVVYNEYMKVRPIAWFMRMFNVVPISETKAKDAIRTTAQAIANGEIVCIFPEGRLTRTGMLNDLKKGFEIIARKAESPVLPVYMDALWGSIFSYERERYFYKAPRRLPYPVTVNFGDPIPHDEVSVDRARLALQDLSADAFPERDDINRPLGVEIVRALKRKPGRTALVEIGKRRRELKRSVVLANAAGLAKVWRRSWPEERRRVGILLPVGSMAAVMNLAAVIAGRTPVNLPLELLNDDTRRQQLLDEHGIDCVITSVALFPGRDLPDGHFDMMAETLQISAGSRIFERIAARLECSCFAVRRLKARSQDPEGEAFAYFSKNEDGGFSFISLTHRNLLASVYQIDSSLIFLPRDEIFLETGFDRISAALSGLWHPLLKRGTAVYRSLAAHQISASLIVDEESPEIVLLSPTMAEELTTKREVQPGITRAYLDFSAEPLRPDQVKLLEEAKGAYLRCFASDKMGGLVTVSTVDPNFLITDGGRQIGAKPESIGRLLPGVSGRIVDDTGRIIGLHEEGRLLVRGGAYVESLERIEIDGQTWIDTGLRGRFDADGFFLKA